LGAKPKDARQGRKFGLGLNISPQPPANVNPGLRSQCKTHLIFRLVNSNDLAAIADAVEVADRALVETMLPQLDVGTCFACGTAIDSPFFAEVPLFGSGASTAEMPEASRPNGESTAVPITRGPLDSSDRITAG